MTPVARRLLAVLVGFVLLLGVLVGRLAQLQLVDGDRYRADAARTATRTVTTPAARGRILDRRGVALVDNQTALTVTADRAVLDRQADRGRAVLTRLAAAVGRDREAMWDRSRLCGEPDAPPAPRCWNGAPQLPVPVAARVDPERALAVAQQPERWPGIAVVAEAQRHYPRPSGAVAAQVVGHLGQATADDIGEGGVAPGDWVGTAGLEATYDADLRGTHGRTVLEIGPDGRALRTRTSSEPRPGRDLVTTLDARVQAAAEKALADAVAAARRTKHPADAAAAVVLDTRTGGVVASASAPGYDPAVWIGGIGPRDLARVAPALPDRVTSHLAPPASTFKALSVQAALATGARIDGRYDCPSSITVGGRAFRNYESQAYGEIDLRRALAVSCDTIFYRFAADRWAQLAGDTDRASMDAAVAADRQDQLVTTARAYGLGTPTGVDLPTDAAGRVPDRAWTLDRWRATKETTCARARSGYPEVADRARRDYLTAIAKERCAGGYVFRPGDAINLSVGQGDLLVTPLQLARAYAALATGGRMPTPHVVDRVVDTVGLPVRAVGRAPRQVPIAPEVKGFLDAGLHDVVTAGTAKGAFAGFPVGAYPVAGKTGTAEVYGKQDTAWFASYGPLPNPRYVVVVMVSQGGTGGSTAAPAARALWDTLRTLR